MSWVAAFPTTIVSDITTETLMLTVVWCLYQHISRDNSKSYFIIPAAKQEPNDYSALNYRTLSFLKSFSKAYEKLVKNEIMSYLDKCCSKFFNSFWLI